MSETVARFRWIGVITLIVGYAILVHHVNVSGQPSSLGAALAVAPLFGIAVAMVGNAASRLTGGLLLGGGGIASWEWWSAIAQHSGFLFWIQDVSLMLALLVTFGRTLLPGHKPLCMSFAEMLHGPLGAKHARYAHQVTIAWTAFFGIMATISTLLFFLAPLAIWSLFANFLVLPLVALMFAAEFLVRRRVLPDETAGHVLDAVRAYLKSSDPH